MAIATREFQIYNTSCYVFFILLTSEISEITPAQVGNRLCSSLLKPAAELSLQRFYVSSNRAPCPEHSIQQLFIKALSSRSIARYVWKTVENIMGYREYTKLNAHHKKIILTEYR